MLSLTIANEYDVRLVLAIGAERREILMQQHVFLWPVLSKHDSNKENMCLKKRRGLLDAGVAEDKLKI